MKKIVKGVLIGLLIIFVLIQFIRPAKNTGKAEATTDIIHAVKVPDTINKIFQVSCYDCHSNNTHYPWYAEVSPMSLLLASHVKGGKKGLKLYRICQPFSPKNAEQVVGHCGTGRKRADAFKIVFTYSYKCQAKGGADKAD